MTVLELDLGNSACKWRLLDGEASVLQRGRCVYGDSESRIELLQQPGQVFVASVAGSEAIESMKQLLDLPKTVQFHRIKTANSLACVKNGYRDITRLGIDRWLALCAAYDNASCQGEARPVLVVDCGSAITLDFVKGCGQHLGGYILPGLHMMLSSLAFGTAQVGAHGIAKTIAPGQITEEAVGHGVVFSAVALIEKAMREAEQLLGESCRVYITGGDAEVLLPHLPSGVSYSGDLVLDGITCYWREQQA